MLKTLKQNFTAGMLKDDLLNYLNELLAQCYALLEEKNQFAKNEHGSYFLKENPISNFESYREHFKFLSLSQHSGAGLPEFQKKMNQLRDLLY